MKILRITLIILVIISFLVPGFNLHDLNLQMCNPAVLVPILLAVLSTAGQLGGQAATNQKAGIERKRYQDQLQGRIDDLNVWFEGENNKDFLNTDVARSAVSGLLGREDRQVNALNNAAEAGGATQEANIAAKGKLNENFAEAIAKLTGYGTQYKQGLRSQYDYRLQSLYQPMDQLSQQGIADWGNLSNNITAAGNSITSAAGNINWEDLLNKQTGTVTTTGGS